MIIYVVTSGSYSDYSIEAIFSSKELAQAYIDLLDNDFNDIEEYDLDNPNILDFIKSGKRPYNVRMDINGNATPTIEHSFYGKSTSATYEFNGNYFGGTHFIHIKCIANDEQHAIKISNEIRTELIALNRWGKNKDDV